jgi:putative hemolysin
MLAPEPIIAGDLEVLIAQTPQQIAWAQELRYRVFVEEMGAKACAEAQTNKRDSDMFDAVCDHLLVMDHSKPKGENPVVGTYRLLRRSVATKFGKFYSESEFDIKNIIAFDEGEVLELGRSCVDAAYRTRSSMQLLWRGIGAYLTKHDIQLMFGCASFNGIDAQQHLLALSYLHHFHAAPENLRSFVLPSYAGKIDYLPKEQIDTGKAIMAMPPLVKGYLRLGCYIGEGMAVDKDYNCLDVCIILRTDNVGEKYATRYSANPS